MKHFLAGDVKTSAGNVMTSLFQRSPRGGGGRSWWMGWEGLTGTRPAGEDERMSRPMEPQHPHRILTSPESEFRLRYQWETRREAGVHFARKPSVNNPVEDVMLKPGACINCFCIFSRNRRDESLFWTKMSALKDLFTAVKLANLGRSWLAQPTARRSQRLKLGFMNCRFIEIEGWMLTFFFFFGWGWISLHLPSLSRQISQLASAAVNGRQVNDELITLKLSLFCLFRHFKFVFLVFFFF